jgi:hypothetical protein
MIIMNNQYQYGLQNTIWKKENFLVIFYLFIEN